MNIVVDVEEEEFETGDEDLTVVIPSQRKYVFDERIRLILQIQQMILE